MNARLTQYYYLATPLFWLVDLLWDAPLRVSFIEDVRLRGVYYMACIGCGIAMWKLPRLTRRIGMAESVANVTLVILSIYLPVTELTDVALAGGEPTLDPLKPINAGISGAIALMSYYSRTGLLEKR